MERSPASKQSGERDVSPEEQSSAQVHSGHMHAVPRFILTAAGVKVSLGKLFSDYECKFDTRQFYLYSVLCFCTCLMIEKFLEASLSSYPHVNWI